MLSALGLFTSKLFMATKVKADLHGIAYMEEKASKGLIQTWIVFKNKNGISKGDIEIMAYRGVWALYRIKSKKDFEDINSAKPREADEVFPVDMSNVFFGLLAEDYELSPQTLREAQDRYYQRLGQEPSEGTVAFAA